MKSRISYPYPRSLSTQSTNRDYVGEGESIIILCPTKQHRHQRLSTNLPLVLWANYMNDILHATIFSHPTSLIFDYVCLIYHWYFQPLQCSPIYIFSLCDQRHLSNKHVIKYIIQICWNPLQKHADISLYKSKEELSRLSKNIPVAQACRYLSIHTQTLAQMS